MFSLEEGVKTTDALVLDAEEESSEAEVEEPVSDSVKRSLSPSNIHHLQHLSVERGGFKDPGVTVECTLL